MKKVILAKLQECIKNVLLEKKKKKCKYPKITALSLNLNAMLRILSTYPFHPIRVSSLHSTIPVLSNRQT